MTASQIAAHLSPWELFIQADAIVRSIMIILLAASVASWAVLLDKLIHFSRLLKRADGWLQTLAGSHSLNSLTAALQQTPNDPFVRIYRAILGEWHETHQQHLQNSETGRDSLKERINRIAHIATGIEVEKLQRGLSVLATVGAVAPFVGLLGTVWGIMNAFQGIAASNNTSLAVVAPGIAEALFATALGLVAAIPAVVGYNRAGGDLNRYTNRLTSLSGMVEVQLSRQLESGQPLSAEASEADLAGSQEAQQAVRLAGQGA